ADLHGEFVPGSVVLSLNGRDVPSLITKNGDVTTIASTTTGIFTPSQMHTARIRFMDIFGEAGSFEWKFTGVSQPLVIGGIALDSDRVRLEWGGGVAPYTLQQSAALSEDEVDFGWTTALSTNANSVSIPLAQSDLKGGTAKFYRIADQTTALIAASATGLPTDYDEYDKGIPDPTNFSRPLHETHETTTTLPRIPWKRDETRERLFGDPEKERDPRDEPPPIIHGEEIDLEPPKRPLIFVPGLLASLLVIHELGEQTEIWPPVGGYRLGGQGLFAADPRRIVEPNVQPVALVPTIYAELLIFLTNRPPAGMGYVLGESLFIFPYDWTDSNIKTGKKFAGFVQVVKKIWNDTHPDAPVEKVDVINHSNGGLVTRAAIIFYDAPVARTIYLASPHYGASKAWFLLHPDSPTLPIAESPILERMETLVKKAFKDQGEAALQTFQQKVKQISQALPSLYELLPDFRFFELLGGQNYIITVTILDDQPRISPRGWQETYLFPLTGFKTHTLVENAMDFKIDLGAELPSGPNLVLYSRDHPNTWHRFTAKVGFTPLQALIDWKFEDLVTDGDGTVQFISARGPGQDSIEVKGEHSEMPNLYRTHNWIRIFLGTTE
ncbi:MAG: hypothetical protein HY674_17985, partial [Chloroflexi bacterium]|nr:hypothetical protein [Chloroflexota bacterium]